MDISQAVVVEAARERHGYRCALQRRGGAYQPLDRSRSVEEEFFSTFSDRLWNYTSIPIPLHDPRVRTVKRIAKLRLVAALSDVISNARFFLRSFKLGIYFFTYI